MQILLAILIALVLAAPLAARTRPRGRDLGIPFPEEAVGNAMLAAETMTGADGIRLFGLPGDRVVTALRKYNRMK